MASVNLNYLLRGPISIYSHMGIRMSTVVFWVDVIHPITGKYRELISVSEVSHLNLRGAKLELSE